MNLQLIKKNYLIILILLIKVILLSLFSSDYKNILFVPFVDHFLHNADNPWQYFYDKKMPNPFPYPPLMLYISSLFYLPVTFLSVPAIVSNLVFKLPNLFADMAIFYILLKLYPSKKMKITWYYLASPIIFYAFYIHSQLDVLPTAILFLSVYYLIKDKPHQSGLLFGLALSIKFHVIAALPLMLIYLYKNKKNPLVYVLYPIVIYSLFVLPFASSTGFQNYVWFNDEQQQVFDIFFNFGYLKVYLAPLAILVIYVRFLSYQKVNHELLFSFMGLLFSIFILLVPPMPAWYIWIVPFISIYFINQANGNIRTTFALSTLFSITYLIYFLFFHTSRFNDMIFLNSPVDLKWNMPHLKNLSFTILEGSLLYIIYFLYRFGLKSNSLYKYKNSAFLIGIGGDSCSGKNTLLEDIYKILHTKEILQMEGDGDHKWERGNENWNRVTHLNPKANYLHRQSDNLMALKRGETIERVDYDHDTGKFSVPRKVQSKDYVVMCGLHPFYLPKMRKALDLKIYLEPEESLRRHWKVLRDMNDRGYTKEKVLSQIEFRMPDAQKYIWPQKQFADLVVSYYTDEEIDVGNPAFIPKVKLKLIVDSSINLDGFLEELDRNGVYLEHDYSEDLQTQYVIMEEEHKKINFEQIADRIIRNRDELIVTQVKDWDTSYRGLIQLLILLMISEKLKED